MNDIKCDSCEHKIVCKYKAHNIQPLLNAYEEFVDKHVDYPFDSVLRCKEFKNYTPILRGTMYQFENYGTGKQPDNLQTYVSNSSKEEE